MQNVGEERRFKENLTILKNKILNNLSHNLSINTNQISTFSSPKNKNRRISQKENDFATLFKLTFIDFNSIEKENYSKKKKTRMDNFGQEIKKGGKQKIAFADELDYVKSENDENTNNKKKNSGDGDNKNKRKNSFSSLYSKYKNNEKNINKIKNIKRNNSFDVSCNYRLKHIYKIIINKAKSKKFNNVDIIEIESTKKENKLNTYYFQKNINLSDEENVSCSCYCAIF
jgi:hypothetical protein